jgi:hypothetical protein
VDYLPGRAAKGATPVIRTKLKQKQTHVLASVLVYILNFNNS